MAQVRDATRADVTEIVRLGGLMYQSIGRTLTDEWRARALADVDSRLGVDLWGWVIDGEEDGTLAACALLDRHPHLAPPGEDSSWRGYVQWVSTDPAHRRKGYARAVMTALHDWATGQGVKVIDLHATYAGRPLYESMGYAVQSGIPMRLDMRGEAT
jgi:GNAT superfamily N-acetyltransferase